jgi:UDP-N-acetylmuramate: L-alanyl-gamma-D-glutamyl-meso-diaminopimelate ligase
MIGGIPSNLGKGARFTDSEFTVLEGDEYDTAFFDKRSKFLHYLPEVVIMNNIEFDHADIYDNIDEIKLTFERLLKIVPQNGIAFINGDDPNCRDVAEKAPAPVKRVGLGEMNDILIEDVNYDGDLSSFTLTGERYTVPMSGEFNIRNAAMAVSAALFSGLNSDEIREGLLSFSGIARRQELKGEAGGVKVIDDFAHHPTAIDLAIDALRQRFPSDNLWVVFEPRSNTTRRKIFQVPLADALSRADKAIVAGVPDPEKVDEHDRLDPRQLVSDVKAQGTEAWFIDEVDDIVTHVAAEAKPGDVVAVLSNGGFGGIHEKLLDALAK